MTVERSAVANSTPAPEVTRSEPPIGQFAPVPGTIDLAWGHPDPDLLPTALVADAAGRALERHGPEALAYGAPQGAGPLLTEVRRRLAQIDGRTPGLDEILVTAGSSAALDQVATLLCRPGDAVLVESPTYHLAFKILRDHPVEIVPVPSGDRGLELGRLPGVIDDVRHRGSVPRLLYLVPTFGNPTGATLTTEARVRLLEIAAAEGITIVEDDTYRELWYDVPPPPSIWSLARAGASAVRLGSFSKSLAPGLRLGYLNASPEIVLRFADGGVLDSGGGNNHFTALVVAELMASGQYAAIVDQLRAGYRARRDALVAVLSASLPPDVSVAGGAGGYFLWLDAGSRDADELLASARRHGTNYVRGETFHVEGTVGRTCLRLSFSRYAPELLAEAGRRLGAALQEVGPRS